MLVLFSILLLFIPLIYQIVEGNKSLKNIISKSFVTVCFLSLIMLFAVTIVSFFLAMWAMSLNGNKCLTGAVGIFGFSFLVGLLMIFIMVVQFVKYKLEERKTKLQENEMTIFDETDVNND